MVTRLVVKRARASGFRKLWIRAVGIFSVFCILMSLMPLISPVSGLSQVGVTVNSGNVIGTNKLSLGFQLTYEWKDWRDSITLRQLAKDANFEMVRLFSYRSEPCTWWNEAARSGTFNWAYVDSLVQRIFEVGAEPLICLGRALSQNIQYYIPAGMSVNSVTGLPNSASWAAYAAEWVKHFKSLGWPVRFYEIFNEPFAYFGWSADYTKLGYFKDVWNAAARAMRAVNPNVLLSFDYTTARRVLNYWVQYGDNLDFLDAHKYDCNSVPGYDDQEVFKRAEERRFLSAPDAIFYGFNDAKQVWFNGRGKMLLTVISESNVNSGWGGGTDPRMAQMTGAVRTALVLRTGILTGLNYHVQYEFSNSASYSHSSGTGYGFGMINSDNDKPWYPYYVQELMGSNLAVNDNIVESTSSSSDMRSVAWVHNGTLNILVICTNGNVDALSLKLYGLQGTLNYSKIDNTISWQTPKVQNGALGSAGSLTMKGYTVVLFQAPALPPAAIFEDGFESGSFSKWTGTSISSGETATISATKPYAGSYSGKFTTNSGNGWEYSYCYKSVDVSEVYVRGYFNISGGLPLVDNSDRLYFIRLVGGQTLVYAGIMREGGHDQWVILVRNGANWMNWKSIAIPSPQMGTWTCVELHWKNDATQGLAELYINGARMIAVAGINTAFYGNATRVDFGLPYVIGVQQKIIVQGDAAKISRTYIGT